MASSAAPSTHAAPITHSVKSKTPNINAALLSRSSQDRTPNVSSSSSDEATAGLLIDAVPEVPAKNKMARTPPPQMTRKMIAVSSEALDTKPKTPAEQLHQHQQQPRPRRPSQHNNGTGVVEKPPEADPIDLNMDAEQPLGMISDWVVPQNYYNLDFGFWKCFREDWVFLHLITKPFVHSFFFTFDRLLMLIYMP